MNIQPMHRLGRRPHAFTMVELLVVIAIIAILAGLLLPAIIGGIRNAELTEVRTTERLIEMAMQAYFNDYGKYPGQNANDDYHVYQDYNLLIETLRGTNVVQGTAKQIIADASSFNWYNQNPKGKIYLDISEKYICTNGAPYTGQSIVAHGGDVQDPWGNRYMVVADWNQDGKIVADGETIQRTMAVWAWGASNKTSDSASETSHIRSWR